MLSILIPTYNHLCLRLVADLQKQCEELQAELGATVFDYEVIVADDASTDEAVVAKNEMMEFLPNCQYVRMQENVGRTLLRNWLLEAAQYPYLLMIDADAEVISEHFIYTYWTHRDDADVLVGGVRTPRKVRRGHELRHRYEWAAERKHTPAYYATHPEEVFPAFNFFFSARVLEKVRFDERCVQYGFEDLLFGIELRRQGYTIAPLDNPLLHLGINSNNVFLQQTETALQTLATVGEPLTSHVRIAQLYQQFHALHLSFLLRGLYRLLGKLLHWHLRGHRPSILLFQCYKLLYYAALRAS